MSRVLIASCWMLIPLGLCSCADDADVRPSPDPVIESTEPTIEIDPSLVFDPSPARQEVAEQLTDDNDQQPASEPSSGNPLIDFFRSVDRGVKSTTANNDEFESIEPGSGKQAADE